MHFTCYLITEFYLIIFSKQTAMDDQCVYARSLLSNLLSTSSYSANSEGINPQSQCNFHFT